MGGLKNKIGGPVENVKCGRRTEAVAGLFDEVCVFWSELTVNLKKNTKINIF